MQTIGHCMHYTGFEPVDRNLKKGGWAYFRGWAYFWEIMVLAVTEISQPGSSRRGNPQVHFVDVLET